MGRKLGSVVFTVALVICFVGYLSIVPQIRILFAVLAPICFLGMIKTSQRQLEDSDLGLVAVLIILAICIVSGLC